MSEQTDPFDFSPEFEAALREKYKGPASDSDWRIFLDMCKRRKLIPGSQVHLTTRAAKEYSEDLHTSVFVRKATFITSIDAFRLIAQRTGDYAGQRQPVYVYLENDAPTILSKYPLPGKQLYGVEVSVLRKTFQEPLTAFARFEAYVSTYRKNNVDEVSPMWARRGPEQCAKCAEALALRQAFPEDLSGLYTDDEMAHVQDEAETAVTPTTATVTISTDVIAPPAGMNPTPATDHGSRSQSEQDFDKGASNTPTPPISAPQSDSTESPEDKQQVIDYLLTNKRELYQVSPSESTDSGLPTKEQYDAYCSRATELKIELERAGLKAGRGLPTGTKLKRYFLKTLGVEDKPDVLKTFTVEQWDTVFATFSTGPLNGQVEAVEFANQKEEK